MKVPMRWSIHPRLLFSISVAGLTSVFLPSWLQLMTRILCSWNSGMFSFLILTWVVMLNISPAMMRRKARMNDERQSVILVIITTAACASLLAIGYIMREAKTAPSNMLILHLGLSIATIVGSWLLVHTIFTVHYAHGYYQADDQAPNEKEIGGLDFPETPEPDYWDFLYYSFVIGMTSQVSDVQITTRSMRRLSLIHGVLSFFFNTTILAMSINIIAGLIN